MAAKKDEILEPPEGAAVVSVTTTTPSVDDETPGMGPGDAEPEHPPVRTTKPDVPVAHALIAGAGAHVPA